MKHKDKSKKNLKWILIGVLLIGSYAISFLLNGFYETNKKLLILIFSVLCGFALFFIVYYTAYLITLLVGGRRLKKRVENSEINCDEELKNIIEKNNYVFSYNAKSKLNDNLHTFLEVVKNLLGKITTSGKNENKYAYANFTVYEVLEMVKSGESVIRNKVDGLFDFFSLKIFNLKNRPLSFVEKIFAEKIEKELNEETAIIDTESESVWQKVKAKVGKVVASTGVAVLKNKIDKTFNDIIVFIGNEALKRRTMLKKSNNNKENLE